LTGVLEVCVSFAFFQLRMRHVRRNPQQPQYTLAGGKGQEILTGDTDILLTVSKTFYTHRVLGCVWILGKWPKTGINSVPVLAPKVPTYMQVLAPPTLASGRGSGIYWSKSTRPVGTKFDLKIGSIDKTELSKSGLS